MPTNALSIDVEEWYHGNLYRMSAGRLSGFETRVVPATERLLEVLCAAGVRATFFFLGVVAREHPDLVRRVAAEGHEVACHGWTHRLLYEMPVEEAREEILRARLFLEDMSGCRVRGFRAPSWSVTSRNWEMLRVVAECGFEYDSSVFPVRTPLFGVPGVDLSISRIGGGHDAWSIIEFPPACFEVWPGIRMPFGGGFFLRMWPYPLIRSWIKSMNENDAAAMIYVHPWEVDRGLPGGLPIIHRVARDFRLTSTLPKIRQLVSDFRVGTAAEVIENALKGG